MNVKDSFITQDRKKVWGRHKPSNELAQHIAEESVFSSNRPKNFSASSKFWLGSIQNLSYSSVLNIRSVPNSTQCEKSTLQIVLMALVCDFGTIQIVLMALKLITHNPNGTHCSGF